MDNNTLVDEQIRARAYELWEKAEEPKESPDMYWEMARAEIEGEGGRDPAEPSGPLGDSGLK